MKEFIKTLKEKISIKYAKEPGKVLLMGIIFLNLILVLGASAIIITVYPSISGGSFWKTVYNVFTMILDAGCISSIVDIEKDNNAFLAVFCIVVIFVGTLIFTGAIIGYLTNIISDFISSANKGSNRLKISNHIVIINWNSRASEIINDLLYSDIEEKIVVLVSENREEVENEIKNRIADTMERERKRYTQEAEELILEGKLSKSKKKKYIKDNIPKNNTIVIVRQGETYSLKQLNDVSLLTAKSVIILGKDENDAICKYDLDKKIEKVEKGNINTIKTLVQVSEITSSGESADNQKVVVEVEDDWTFSLVEKIIHHKEKKGKCNIVAIPVNKILGQILSQFSIMPELNTVYSELFSNKGATFYSKRFNEPDENEYFEKYLQNHSKAIPVAVMDREEGKELFYIAQAEEDYYYQDDCVENVPALKLRENFRFRKRHIAIIGHNSKCNDIFEGFSAFINEWDPNQDLGIVDILIIDDKKHLEKMEYYINSENNKYWYINKIVEADVYDREIIQNTLNEYIDSHSGDTSILILSDDNAIENDIDSNALTYLIYLQDIISSRLEADPDFDVESVDIIVELLNPKNYDVARSYSVDNVIISNRYISRMIAQVGEKEEIFEFYKDILTYDTEYISENAYESKELYAKFAKRFFDEDTVFPIITTPREFVKSVYDASPENNKNIVLGYKKPKEKGVIFVNTDNGEIEINAEDKLLLFSAH